MDYKQVYDCAFQSDCYNNQTEDEFRYVYAIEQSKAFSPQSVIDIGSGKGTFLKQLEKLNCSIYAVDVNQYFQNNNVTFIRADLSKGSDRQNLIQTFENNKIDYLYCLDVLEHLDYSFIEYIFEMFSKIAKRCIFTIANHSDIINGVELHTIQETNIFWDKLIQKYFNILNFDTHYGSRLYVYNVETRINKTT